jgi:hypothetical protein
MASFEDKYLSAPLSEGPPLGAEPQTRGLGGPVAAAIPDDEVFNLGSFLSRAMTRGDKLAMNVRPANPRMGFTSERMVDKLGRIGQGMQQRQQMNDMQRPETKQEYQYRRTPPKGVPGSFRGLR